jgi:chorismate synthase
MQDKRLMIRFMTAGESHGPMLVGIIEGLPAGLRLQASRIDEDLRRRQAGHGRGARMKIEADAARIVTGLRGSLTLGSPLTILIENRDWKNWKSVMDPIGPASGREVYRPRPGHADLSGGIKYGFEDLRNALERASARETAMRVALGGVCRQYLAAFGVDILSHVTQIGGIAAEPARESIEALRPRVEASPVRCADRLATRRMIARIDAAKTRGDTLGGVFEIIAEGVVAGLGSYVQWDRRLDAQLSRAILSIPAVKGMEIGLGFAQTSRYGTEVHDPIEPARRAKGGIRFKRPSNNAGGLEGGVTNGQPIVLRGAMKPISTTMKGIPSVDIRTRKKERSSVERSDVCAVPAAGVVGEAVVALALAQAYSEKFGGDSMGEVETNFEAYAKAIAKR